MCRSRRSASSDAGERNVAAYDNKIGYRSIEDKRGKTAIAGVVVRGLQQRESLETTTDARTW